MDGRGGDSCSLEREEIRLAAERRGCPRSLFFPEVEELADTVRSDPEPVFELEAFYRTFFHCPFRTPDTSIS